MKRNGVGVGGGEERGDGGGGEYDGWEAQYCLAISKADRTESWVWVGGEGVLSSGAVVSSISGV